MPQAFYRRRLPHLQWDDKPHFVTFCTDHRWILPQPVRSLVLDSCLHDNGKLFDLRVAVVMPDHVHMIFTPLVDQHAMEVCSLAEIMDAIKGASAHKVNKLCAERVESGSLNLLIMYCVHPRASMRRFNSCWRILCGWAWPGCGPAIPGSGRSLPSILTRWLPAFDALPAKTPELRSWTAEGGCPYIFSCLSSLLCNFIHTGSFLPIT